MERATEGVLFDFAGTLFAPRETTDCVSRAANTLGVKLSEPQVAELAKKYRRAGFPGGPYPDQVPADVAKSYAIRDLSSDAHRAAYVGLLKTVSPPVDGFAEALYEQVLSPNGWVPYKGARELIGALTSDGIRVGLVSNVGFDLRPVLQHHGMEVLARACTLSFEHGMTKPDARIFQRALDDIGVTAERTLMVGDHPEADGGAAQLGIRTLIWPMAPPGEDRGLERVLSHLTPDT